MRQFLEFHTTLRVEACGDDREPRRNCIERRGGIRPAIVYVDGFPATPPALDLLDSYGPRDLHSIEYFECDGGLGGQPRRGLSGNVPIVPFIEIHAYTYAYMETQARRPRIPMPPCL
jgi:hypothetical protein